MNPKEEKKKRKEEEGQKSYQDRRVKKYAKSLRKAPQPISPVCLGSLAQQEFKTFLYSLCVSNGGVKMKEVETRYGRPEV